MAFAHSFQRVRILSAGRDRYRVVAAERRGLSARKLRGLFVVLAIAGSLSGAWACGGRTGVEVFDDLGTQGGGQDATLDSTIETDATGDSAPDVVLADVAVDALSCPEASDSGTLPPSCAPGGLGMTNCGQCSESCCTSLEVLGGTFYRTYTNDGDGPSKEADPATVSSFRLDKYEVTVGRFRQFVAAWNGGYKPAAGSGKHTYLNGGRGLANIGMAGGYEPGWLASDDNNLSQTDTGLACQHRFHTWTTTPTTQENLPIDCANWWEAYAFCIWDGGFLPSETEYEYAAAGGDEQLEYPWGSMAPGTMNQYAIYDLHYTGNFIKVAPVGTATLGVGRWGQLDLAGSTWQWNLDWYDNYVDPCTDCANLNPSSDSYQRTLRGSGFDFHEYELRSYVRYLDVPPDTPYNDIGFRCARAP
jgi:formylglycine-generating enzyme